MNTLKCIRLREEGSLKEHTFKRAIVQKCDWAYEDFEIAEMVQDSTMRTLQGRFRKEGDENTCLQKSVDTLITVGRMCCHAREKHKLYNAKLSEESEETARSEIAKMANKVIKNYHRSTSLSDSLEYWRYLDDFYDPSRENDASVSIICPSRYQILE